jgi:hypothetical protein
MTTRRAILTHLAAFALGVIWTLMGVVLLLHFKADARERKVRQIFHEAARVEIVSEMRLQQTMRKGEDLWKFVAALDALAPAEQSLRVLVPKP